MTTSNAKRVYPPVDRCIYCGEKQAKLTKEHIIAFALGGKLILPKSSRRACADITMRFERACCRRMLGPMRLRLGAPTNHPKERPNTLTLNIRYSDGTIKSADVSIKEYPTAFALPIFPAPGILSGLAPETTWKPRVWHSINHEEGRRIVAKFGGTGFVLPPVKTLAFAQMLAKIAHSYAIARMGLNKFKPLLLDLILGRTSVVTHLVGGDLEVPPKSRFWHELDLQREYSANGQTYVLTNIRLLARLGTPQYYVVVGER